MILFFFALFSHLKKCHTHLNHECFFFLHETEVESNHQSICPTEKDFTDVMTHFSVWNNFQIKSGDTFFFLLSEGCKSCCDMISPRLMKNQNTRFCFHKYWSILQRCTASFMQHIIEHKLQILISVDELLYVWGHTSWSHEKLKK